MLRNRMMGGASWLVMRAPDDEGAGGGGGGGDAGGDQGGGAAGGDTGAGAADAGDQGRPGARNDGAAAQQQDSGADGAAGAPGGAGADQGGTDGGAAAGAGGDVDWRDKDRERLRRRVREEADAKAALEAENKRIRELLDRVAAGSGEGGDAGAGDGGAGGRVLTQADVQREAERIAAERLREAEAVRTKAEFDRACNTAVTSGRSAYTAPKFDEALQRLAQIGFYGDDGNGYENLNMALATDDPAGVMYELGQNPDEYYRIMDLPPLRRHGEFVKLAIKAQTARNGNGGNGGNGNGQRRPSGAPPPTDPLRGGGGDADNRYSENISAADWHAQEAKREREYWERKNAAFRAG